MSADRVLALLLLAGAAIYLAVLVPEVGATQMSMGSGDFYTVGPTALPNFSGAMVALFSLAVLVMPRSADERGIPFTTGLKGALTFGTATVVYALLMPRIGFLPASVIFLAAVFALFRVRSWLIAVILVVVLPVLIDQILRKVFLIPLPGSALF